MLSLCFLCGRFGLKIKIWIQQYKTNLYQWFQLEVAYHHLFAWSLSFTYQINRKCWFILQKLYFTHKPMMLISNDEYPKSLVHLIGLSWLQLAGWRCLASAGGGGILNPLDVSRCFSTSRPLGPGSAPTGLELSYPTHQF